MEKLSEVVYEYFESADLEDLVEWVNDTFKQALDCMEQDILNSNGGVDEIQDIISAYKEKGI